MVYAVADPLCTRHGSAIVFFDLLTFGSLHLGFGLGIDAFRTGWFIESIATQVLVIFIIRTRSALIQDHPHWVLSLTTFCALGAALAIPLSPFGAWFGFTGLPLYVYLALALIIVLYIVSAEMMKRYAMQ